jgi:hypothetical protein
MEFQGRIKKLLPVRSGISQRTGNEWKSLPFIFEYFEHETDRFADTVLLETFDIKVIENLKENMTVRCGFGHRTREYEDKVYNEVKLYKIESVRAIQQPANASQGQQQSVIPEQKVDASTGAENDDLPF